MSWQWCVRFAREHNVPIWRFGARKQLIPIEPMLAAMERIGAQQAAHREPMTRRERIDEILRSVGLERIETEPEIMALQEEGYGLTEIEKLMNLRKEFGLVRVPKPQS
jgi:hypothetical protein